MIDLCVRVCDFKKNVSFVITFSGLKKECWQHISKPGISYNCWSIKKEDNEPSTMYGKGTVTRDPDTKEITMGTCPRNVVSRKI